MRVLSSLVLATGCAVAGPQPDHFETVPAGADGTMTLVLEEIDRADAVLDVEVLGGPLRAPIVLAVAPAGDGPGACLEEIAPVCLHVGPELTGEKERRTDDDGEAWWSVPWGLAEGSGAVDLQAWAVAGDEVWVSNALRVELP